MGNVKTRLSISFVMGAVVQLDYCQMGGHARLYRYVFVYSFSYILSERQVLRNFIQSPAQYRAQKDTVAMTGSH